MPQCGRAKCDACNYDVEVVEGWDRVEGLYHTACGIPLPVRARWIWCSRCGVSQAEDLPKQFEIKRELRRTRWNFIDWGVDDWQYTRQVTGTNSPVRRKHRQILMGLLDLVNRRRTPARCLSCGDVNYRDFHGNIVADGRGTLSHDKCRGTVTLELNSIWTGILERYNAYDGEGIRIGEYLPAADGWRLNHHSVNSTNQAVNPSR